MKPRTVLLAAFAICITLISFSLMRVHAQQHSPTPLTAQITSTYYRYPTGEFVKKEQTIVAIRADGSRAESRMFTIGGVEGEQRTVTDIGKRRTLNVDGPTQSVTTYSMTDREVLRAKADSQRSCEDGVAVNDRLLGYRVIKTTKHPGELRIDDWSAPDLGCFVLKRDVYGPSGDILVTAVEARSIAVGEPDARFFSVPPQYVERSPSEVQTEFMHRFPTEVPEDPENVRRSDAWYHKVNQSSR